MKKAKKFTFIVISLFFLIPITYIILYHLIGIQEIKISHSYRQFLLQYTKGPRFIIESGSNSIHSIEAYTLEKKFNIQTIIISDAADYPLSKKLQRLKKYAKKEDIILLPLEYHYYSRKKIVDVFRDNILGSLNFYYNYDYILNELNQIKSTPLKSVFKNIYDRYKFYRNQNLYLDLHFSDFENNKRGSSILDKQFDANIKKTCDQYILEEQIKNGFKLSKTFKENIKTIKKLKQEGYKIFFTWPVVVGDDCFSKKYKSKLDTLITEIKKYLKENDITIIEDPFDNKFPAKFISDTYYHINFEAKKIRTKRLIDDIRQSPIYEYISKNSKESYSHDIAETKQNIINLLDKVHKKNEQITFKDAEVIYQNWSKAEKKFRWSSGNNSKLIFKINPKEIEGFLYLHLKTLGKQKIELSINGNYIESMIVDSNNTKVRFKFDPKILSQTNTISFYLPNAHKPNDKDSRILAIALKSFMIK